MIGIFRSFNPLNALWLAIVLFALRVGYMLHAPANIEFTFVEPFARTLVPLDYEHFFSPGVNVFLAAVLVFIQALLLNYLVNRDNLLSKPSFLPTLHRPSSRRSCAMVNLRPEDIGDDGKCVSKVNRFPVRTFTGVGTG